MCPKVDILDGSRETLVLLRVVVLKADLEVHGLGELPLLGFLGVLQDGAHALVKSFLWNFAENIKITNVLKVSF